MKLGLIELLFHAPLGKDNLPLFQNHTQLTKAVMAAGLGYQNKKFESVSAFLSQAIRGRGASKRRPSQKLKESIRIAVEKRLSPTLNHQEIMSQFDLAFRALENPGLVELPIDAKDEFEALVQESKNANTHYISTFMPAESMTKSLRAAELRHELVENLNLNNGELDESLSEPKKHYIFNLPRDKGKMDKHDIAINFWQGFYTFLSEELKMQNALEILNRWDEEDNAPLQVYVQEPVLCTFPSVVYNPELTLEELSSGFVFFYHGSSRISVARMSKPAIYKWYETIYLPSITSPTQYGRERFLFRRCNIL